MKYKIELLKEAYNNRAIDLIVDKATEKGEDYKALVNAGLIKELEMPYNALPFRDKRGNLHQIKNVMITRKGIEELYENKIA